MDGIILDSIYYKYSCKKLPAKFPITFQNRTLSIVNAILAMPCFQVTLKQESTRHFSAEFVFMRLHNIFADQTGSNNLCLQGFFNVFPVLYHHVAEKMLFCMQSGTNPSQLYIH